MTNIAITQRITSFYEGKEIRESLDIRWYDFAKSCGFSLVPISVKHEVLGFLREMNISGVIFSGGNDLFVVNAEKVNEMRDIFEKNLLQEAINRDIPIIGICRGMQLINSYFAGTLQRVAGHVATTHRISNDSTERFVNSFHNYALQNISDDFEVDFRASDGVVEAFHHKNKHIYATMWHPEREEIFKDADIVLFQKVFQRKI